MIKNKLREHIVPFIIENLLDEDYPLTFNMDEFKKINSFKGRVDYCTKHLKRISAGTSRIVFMIDETKVLKLAKNQKGIAQCETEIEWGNDSYFNDILAKVFDSDSDGLWVEMELARKVKKDDFKRLYNIDFDTFGKFLHNFYSKNRGRRALYLIDDITNEKYSDNEFVQNIIDFMENVDASAGDLGRINSYGIVKRDGIEKIVLIDYGLTSDVYNSYYV